MSGVASLSITMNDDFNAVQFDALKTPIFFLKENHYTVEHSIYFWSEIFKE